MVTKVEKQNFENYLAEARSWETDKIHELKKSRKVAWIISIVATSFAFLTVLALALLTPLKSVQPYVIRVDNSTGAVDIVNALRNGKTNYDEAMNKYFTQWYVRWREGYSRPLASEFYRNVGMLSGSDEQGKFAAYFNPKNPLSPLNVYGASKSVTVQIKSTSFISPEIALVRYSKQIEQSGVASETTHWQATIVFRYVATPMSEQDRAINPLGFQVMEYRNDPDAQVAEGRPVAAPIPMRSSNSQTVPAIQPVR